MTLFSQRARRWTAMAGILMSAGASLFAQPSGPVPTLRTAVPFPPPLKSPVDTFRELLAMSATERRQFLTNRPPEAQKQILAKLREYQSLKPEEREARLRATELRWYLVPLMNESRTNRDACLALIPLELKPLVEDRLRRWDRVPRAVQQEWLNNDLTARYFSNPQLTNHVVLSPERRARLEAGLDGWQKLSESERERTLAGFYQFFELTPQEKQQALNTLSDAERRQMERTLQAYEKLTAAQRARCASSFEKFANLNLAERQLFLKNAERWKLMSAEERQTWRQLVNLAPLVPSARQAFPLPPAPPRAATMPATPTNAN